MNEQQAYVVHAFGLLALYGSEIQMLKVTQTICVKEGITTASISATTMSTIIAHT